MPKNFAIGAALALSIINTSACIPLTVGSTANPVPVGTSVRNMSTYVVPRSFEDSTSDYSLPRYGVDGETRFGFDAHSDIGIRVPNFSGVVVNYKRRLNGRSDDPGSAIALMTGGGIINLGTHAHLEATLIASSEDNDRATPYGGVRAMQVFPLEKGAVHDSPTLGGFFGVRLGSSSFGMSPEIGVFYDRSALGIRNNNVLFVPAITLHGDLARLLRPW